MSFFCSFSIPKQLINTSKDESKKKNPTKKNHLRQLWRVRLSFSSSCIVKPHHKALVSQILTQHYSEITRLAWSCLFLALPLSLCSLTDQLMKESREPSCYTKELSLDTSRFYVILITCLHPFCISYMQNHFQVGKKTNTRIDLSCHRMTSLS